MHAQSYNYELRPPVQQKKEKEGGNKMATLELAIHLVKQAIDQDSNKNYEEAARCYREALVNFETVAKARGVSKGVRHAINIKCQQYSERLRKLDQYLLGQADLSKLFKDVVSFHEQNEAEVVKTPEKKAISKDSIHSHDSASSCGSIRDRPLFKQGMAAIERGKRKDQRRQYMEALHNYEDGMALLLDAAASDEGTSEPLRFKCLLVHERIENIRNHLESGAPIVDRKDSLETIEYSLSDCGSETVSPEPLYEEDKALLMEEVHSGSRHSLYPQCEIKTKEEQVIPLADLNGELKLSLASLASSTTSSIHKYMKDSSFEADCNVTELTCANSGIDFDTYKSYVVDQEDKRSDSGLGDHSPKTMSVEATTPTSTIIGSDNESEDAHVLEVHRSVDGTPIRLTPTRISPTTSLKRKNRVPSMEEELTVLSRDVVDSSIQVKPNHKVMMAYSKPDTKARPEYVPPRAFAKRNNMYDDEDEDDVNKGCLYFLACLDTLWIL